MDDIKATFEHKLGAPLKLGAIESAAAVIRVANTKMAGAIRMVSLSLGADPRDFTLFAFGGAGPLHATALARELGIPKVMVPCRPGITNALGCIVADLRHDFVNTINKPLDSADIDDVHSIFATQIAEGESLIRKETTKISSIKTLFSVDMQFVGQTHLLRVPLETCSTSRAELRTLFEEAYFERFQVELAEIKANLVNINTSIIGTRPELDLTTLIDPDGRKSSVNDAKIGARQVYFDNSWLQTPVYWRDHLPLELELIGPAIIEQLDCTTVLEPTDIANGDNDGNILITLGERA